MVVLKNPDTGVEKKRAVGFNWWVLFFGWLVPLVSGEFKICGSYFVVYMIFGVVIEMLNVSEDMVGIFALLLHAAFAFTYNKTRISSLLSKGYVPADKISKNILLEKNLSANENVTGSETEENSVNGETTVATGAASVEKETNGEQVPKAPQTTCAPPPPPMK